MLGLRGPDKMLPTGSLPVSRWAPRALRGAGKQTPGLGGFQGAAPALTRATVGSNPAPPHAICTSVLIGILMI